MAGSPLSPRFNLKNFHDTRTNIISRSNSDASINSSQSFQPILNSNMRHPWGVVDYYLYLGNVEGNRDTKQRAGECFLLEKDGFKNVEFNINMSLENIPNPKTPTIVFLSLPVPDFRDDCFTVLVLAFDAGQHRLQARIFNTETLLEDYKDLWLAWNRGAGQFVIDVSVDSFLECVDEVMKYQTEVLDVGIMHHFGMTKQQFPCGFDAVIVIQYLQFIGDHSDLLWEYGENFRIEFGSLQCELRDILMKGSREAWFAARHGRSALEFRKQTLRQLAGMNFFWMQTVLDLREEVAVSASAPPTPTRDQSIEAPLRVRTAKWRKPSWLTVSTQFALMSLLGVCFLAVFLCLMSIYGAPSKGQSPVSLFGWRPFESKALKSGIFGQWPLNQIIEYLRLLGLLPFAPEPRGMRLLGLWPFRPNTQQAMLSRWLRWDRIVPGILGWRCFKQRGWQSTTELLKMLSGNPHFQKIKSLSESLRVQSIESSRRWLIAPRKFMALNMGFPKWLSGGVQFRTRSFPQGPFGVSLEPARYGGPFGFFKW